MVVLRGGALFYERGTSASTLSSRPAPGADSCVCSVLTQRFRLLGLLPKLQELHNLQDFGIEVELVP